jgi:hypothetical protein
MAVCVRLPGTVAHVNEPWLKVQVEIVRGRSKFLSPRPGRIFLVGPKHSFDDLAEAIECGFGRWDRSPRYEFRLRENRIAKPLVEKPADYLKGQQECFAYLFDPVSNWEHICQVVELGEDWTQTFPAQSEEPYPTTIDGWGSLPDQYGRDGSAPDYGLGMSGSGVIAPESRSVSSLSAVESELPTSMRGTSGVPAEQDAGQADVVVSLERARKRRASQK